MHIPWKVGGTCTSRAGRWTFHVLLLTRTPHKKQTRGKPQLLDKELLQLIDLCQSYFTLDAPSFLRSLLMSLIWHLSEALWTWALSTGLAPAVNSRASWASGSKSNLPTTSICYVSFLKPRKSFLEVKEVLDKMLCGADVVSQRSIKSGFKKLRTLWHKEWSRTQKIDTGSSLPQVVVCLYFVYENCFPPYFTSTRASVSSMSWAFTTFVWSCSGCVLLGKLCHCLAR